MEGLVSKTVLPWILSVLLVALTSLWIVKSSSQLSATFDEPVYLKCGLDCWANNTHKPLMRLGTMPLPVDVATLPIHIWYSWTGKAPDWEADFGWMLAVARTTALIFWWNLLLQCFRLGSRIGGGWCGFFAVSAVGLEPNLMGHAALATTDIAVTGCMIATLVAYLKYQSTPSRWNWWETVLWWAMSLFAKASALVFVPILILSAELPILWAVFWNPEGRGGFGETFRKVFRLWMRMGFTALTLVFLFCGSDFKQEITFVSWAKGLNPGPIAETMVWISENLRIFTNAGEGFAQQIKHNLRGHPSYLLGTSHESAVWYHFPVLLLIKLPTWFFVLLPLILWRQRRNPWLPGLIACGFLLAFSVNCRVQIGLRLIFPLVVMLMVMLGVSLHDWWQSCRNRWLGPTVGSLAFFVGAVATMANQFPDGLRYTNDFWGQKSGPQKMVSDSNYDWGQGLLELADNMRPFARADQPVWVVYWGADPRVNHFPLRRMVPLDQRIISEETLKEWLSGRTIAVSATILFGPPLPPPYELLRKFFQNQSPDQQLRCFTVYSFPPKKLGKELASPLKGIRSMD